MTIPGVTQGSVRPQNIRCTSAELRTPGSAAKHITATSRSRVLVGLIGRTRCSERQPSKIWSVPGGNSAVVMLAAALLLFWSLLLGAALLLFWSLLLVGATVYLPTQTTGRVDAKHQANTRQDAIGERI